MERILQVWNVDGLNHFNRPFVRILYEEDLLPEGTRQRVSRQIGISEGSPVAEISKRLVSGEQDYCVIPESFKSQRFIHYLGIDEKTALSLFRTSTYLLDRLVHNPDTTLEHVIKEVRAPIHSSTRPFVIGVTGTNGKTSVVNLIYQILMNCVGSNLKVGKMDSLNVEINSSAIGGITDEQYDSSRYLLSQDIDVAVLELTRKGIWFSGLPTRNISTGVITNITYDHIGSYGITNLDDLVKIKSVVARNAKNAVVLNYDDLLLRRLGGELKDHHVIYFSLNGSATKFESNGVFLDNNGMIIIKSDGQEKTYIDIREIPYCEYGKIQHHVENILAAIAALYFDPNTLLDLEKTSSYLRRLRTNDLIPGRFNLFEFANRKVIFDYAHNPDGIRKIGTALRGIDSRVHSCLISIAENRDLEFCREMATQLAAYFNPVYLKETDEECKSKGGITIKDLEFSIRNVDPQTTVIFLPQFPYQNYIQTIKEGEIGVVLGGGLGDVSKTRKLILQYIMEAAR